MAGLIFFLYFGERGQRGPSLALLLLALFPHLGHRPVHGPEAALQYPGCLFDQDLPLHVSLQYP